MPYALDNWIAWLTGERVHRWCNLWRITRQDAVTFRFTDHDRPVIFPENGTDQTYTPSGGVNATAYQKTSSLRPDNLEIVGIINDATITASDLRTGKFREAEIDHYLVDWRYPWAGAIQHNRYWIVEVTYNGEEWQAKIEGIGRWLNQNVGEVYGRTCRHTLGDTACGINLASWTDTGEVGAVSNRRIFTIVNVDPGDQAAGRTAGYFQYGLLTFTSGNNSGLAFEVKAHVDLTGTKYIEFYVFAPYTIQAGDRFTVYAGCNKIWGTCKNQFFNQVNFGGFPFIPGNDAMLQTPLSK